MAKHRATIDNFKNLQFSYKEYTEKPLYNLIFVLGKIWQLFEDLHYHPITKS